MTDKKRKPGGGRKLKYGEPLSRFVCYCPESKVKDLRKIVKAKLKEYEGIGFHAWEQNDSEFIYYKVLN